MTTLGTRFIRFAMTFALVIGVLVSTVTLTASSTHASSQTLSNPAAPCPPYCAPILILIPPWRVPPPPCLQCPPDDLPTVGDYFTLGALVNITVQDTATGAIVVRTQAIANIRDQYGQGSFTANLIVKACKSTSLMVFAVDTKTRKRTSPVPLPSCG